MRSTLACFLLVSLFAAPAVCQPSQVLINELGADTPDFVEIVNVGATPIDVSGWKIETYQATTGQPLFDMSWTIPAGTTPIPAGGVLVGQDSTTGVGGNIYYTGVNIFFIAGYSMEVILYDATNTPVDYVFHNKNLVGPSVNQPIGITWTGTLVAGTSSQGAIYRPSPPVDTDAAADWAIGTSAANGSKGNPNPMPMAGALINEFYTGASAAVELRNSTASAIGLTNATLLTFTDAGGGLVADPPFVFPAGVSIPANGFLVLEAGGVAGSPGTYPNSIYTGIAWGWNGSMSVEIVLLNDSGYGLDYVIYDHFGTIAGAGPNLVAPTTWTGDFDMGTGDTHERVQIADTNTATDWAKNTNAHSLGTYNPPQVSGTMGIVFNEFNMGSVDYVELLNTTANPVDVSGYVIKSWYMSTTGTWSNDGNGTIPTVPPIPAGGVICLLEAGTAGAAGAYPNSYYLGWSFLFVSSDELEAVLYGPLGILPIDFVRSYQSENPNKWPGTNNPGLPWTGAQVCVNQVSADIIERMTLVERDNAGDWKRQGTGVGTTPGALNPLQTGSNAYFSHYGTGCIGAYNIPVLSGTGSPAPGNPITLEMTFTPVAAPMLICVGLGTGSLPMNPGCNLQVNPLAFTIPFSTGSTTYMTLPATLPASVTTPFDIYVQVLYGDAVNPWGISSTNPLQIHIDV